MRIVFYTVVIVTLRASLRRIVSPEIHNSLYERVMVGRGGGGEWNFAGGLRNFRRGSLTEWKDASCEPHLCAVLTTPTQFCVRKPGKFPASSAGL